MCGVTLILLPTSSRGALNPSPPKAAKPPAAPAAPATCESAPRPPPTSVCRGMFSPTLILAATLSVAMMCGVARTFPRPELASAFITMPKAGMLTPGSS